MTDKQPEKSTKVVSASADPKKSMEEVKKEDGKKTSPSESMSAS